MLRFTFKKGLVFVVGQERCQLVRRLVTGKLQLEWESGELENLTDKEVLERWQKGEWVIDQESLGTSKDAIYLATPRDLSTFPASWQEKAKRRLKYIEVVDPNTNKYRPSQWQVLIDAYAEAIGDAHPPSASTVHAWWVRYRSTKSITTLVPLTRSGRPRHNDSRYLLFEETIATLYLNHQKLPKLDVFNHLRKKSEELNAGRQPAEQIKAPSKSTVYRWIDELQQDIVDAARLGADAARVKYRMVLGGVEVTQILERIEIDHTPLDVLVVEKNTYLPLGRPWLTLAIDRKSRMIVGFYISFNAPSAHSVLQCLRRAILPKDELLARYPSIKGQWPAYGIPVLIAVDNGMDLHSDALEKTCLELGILILYCPSATPQYKGAVERFFRTMAKDLIHRLPGTVFSNVDERGDYPSEGVACVDLELLVELITLWIVNVYNVKFHRGLGTTPLQAWMEGAAKRPIELPVFPQQLDVLTGIPATRTLFHYGIELDGLHYNSRQLQEIRRRSGENIRIQLKFYEDTVVHVHIFDPYAKEYLQVPVVQSNYAEDLPRSVHRMIRERARRECGENFSSAQLEEAKQTIQDKIRQALRDKKMATRKQGAQLTFHDSEAIFASENPLAEASKPVKSGLPVPPPEIPSGLDDVLPAFNPIDATSDGEGAR